MMCDNRKVVFHQSQWDRFSLIELPQHSQVISTLTLLTILYTLYLTVWGHLTLKSLAYVSNCWGYRSILRNEGLCKVFW